MRNQLKTVYSVLAVVATLGLTASVHGVPAFARQTGLDCNSCHASPGYPALNTFGQAFKASGYTQASEDNLMGDGEALSIPKTLNMSVVFKIRSPIDLTAKTATTKASTSAALNFPDEIAFLSGGKVGKNIGYLIEMGGSFGNFKLMFTPEIGPVRLGIVPFFNEGVGPAYAFEPLSTGNAEMIRITERKSYTSAQEGVDWGGKNAGSGVGLYVWHPMGFVSYVPYLEGIGEQSFSNGLNHYIRAAVTPSFSGIDTALGATYKTGKDLNYIAVDAQVGATLGIPLFFVVTYANDLNAAKAKTAATDLAIAVDAQIIQDMLNVVIGGRFGLDKNSESLSNIGAAVKYQIVRNIRFSLEWDYNLKSGDMKILPMIFGAF